MRKLFLLLFLFNIIGPGIIAPSVKAQCSICTKTAQQLGEKPAKALNGAILYLAAFPLLIMGYIGYRWYESQRNA